MEGDKKKLSRLKVPLPSKYLYYLHFYYASVRREQKTS